MKSIIAIVLAVIAFSVAQPALVRNATELTLGQMFSGALVPQIDSQFYGIPDLLYVYLPINTKNITITFVQPDGSDDCEDLYVLSSVEGFPCTSAKPFSSSSPDFLCYESSYELYDSGSFSATYYAGASSGAQGNLGFGVLSGGYLYFSLSRYYSGDAAKSCPYTFEIDADYCPSGQVAIGDSYVTGMNCVAYTNVTTNNTSSFSGTFSQGVFTDSTGDDTVYRLDLPQDIASVTFTVYSNDSLYVYGQNHQVIRSTSYGCYVSSSSNGDSYFGTVTCSGVQPGNYYVYIYGYYPVQGNITISTMTCSGSGVGPFCNSTFINVTQAFETGMTSFIVTETAGAYGCGLLPQLGNNILNVYPVGNTSYPNLYYGRGGYPTSGFNYISYYTSAYYSVGFSYLDMIGPYDSNRICFYVSDCSYEVCEMNLYVNTTAIYYGATTGSVSGAMTTGASNGTMTTGAAVTTGLRMTTGTPAVTTGFSNVTMTTGVNNGTMTTGSASNGTSTGSADTTTGSAMSVIPSILLVALIALMF